MFPLGEKRFRVLVAGGGDAVRDSLADGGVEAGRPLDVDGSDAAAVRDGALADRAVDCVVVDGGEYDDGGVEPVTAVRETDPQLPVVALVDGDDGVVRDALAAGATDAVPRRLADDDPPLLADHVASVTEREQARTAFGDVYDGIPGPVSVHDADTGRMVHANRALCDLLGYDRGELLSLEIEDVTADVAGYDHERAMNLVESVARTDTPVEVDWPLATGDGEVRWLEARLSPVTVGGREYVLSASREVTEQRRREREYEAVFDGVNDVISVHDPWNEELLDVNETLCELTGYSRDALLSMGLDGFSATGDGFVADRAYETQQRVAATGDPETVDWVVETAAGDRRRLECVLSPATIGGEDRVLVLARDVTERRQLEQTYREVFESVSDGLVVHDPDTGEIVDANERYCDLTGYDRDELVGSDVRLIVPGDAEGAYREALDRIELAREEGQQLFEFDGERKDGGTFTGEVNLRVAEIRGEERVLASVRDVTDRKHRERAVRELQAATERMQDADAAERVAETAVEAAADALGLPVAACWFHDPDEDRLEPVAATDAVRERGLLSPLEPDRYEYEAFREDEVATYVPREENPDNPLETAVLLPLGDHGLIAAGHPEETEYDGVTLDVARTLAEHAESALDRIERARAVRESERRLRVISERIDQVIFLAAPDFSEMVYVNDAYEDIWGRPVDELFDDPRRFIDHVDDRDREDFEAAFEAMLADIAAGDASDAYEFRYRIRRPDGDVRWVRTTGYPVDGDDPQFVGVAEDVTGQRELERAYRSVFENVSDGLVVHDPDTGEIVDVNDRFCEMNGYDREELVGETVDVVTGPDHGYEDAQRRVERAREEGPQLFEWRNRRSDGETFPVEVHLSVVDIRGEERVLASVRDITERKRREREYEQIFDGVNDSIVVQDPETAQPLDANETFLDRLGYDSVEAVREAGFDALSATDAGYTTERARELCHRVVETGEPETVEWQQETRDGDRRWIEATVDTAEIGGEERVLSIQRDVTERRRTERRLTAILDRIDEAIFLTRAHAITESSQEPDYVSAGYEDIWGQPLEDIRDRYQDGFFGTLHPDDEPDYRSFVESIVADVDAGDADDRYTTEYRIRRPDDELRWVQSDYYPVEWASGPPRVVIVSRDVTDRKERERRLASFEDATDDLTTADTREEAARTAVDAATDALDLSAVGVLLYDHSEGVLEADARSAALPSEVAERTVGPNDGRLWDAFAAGETVGPGRTRGGGAVEDESASDVTAALADWRAIPLGNHGVLFVGAADAGLDPDALQSAHVLAATLEAALNHLHGKRRLASREEELRTETERAERLDRIARLTQQVEAAITEASAPSEVERAVCERLVDAAPYEVAWIGGVEVGTDRIAPSTVVGESDRYVEAMDLTTTGDAADRHPAVEAWQGDGVSVTDSIVGSGPAEDWREHALSHGYQSVCAVPLTYDGMTHGVLSVAADAPNAFGERTRDVLGQLGTSIAHALAGIERRRALEADETVELEFRGDGTGLAFARLAAEAGCHVRHERTVQRDGDGVSVYFALDGDLPGAVDETASRLLSGTAEVVRDEPDTVLLEVRTDTWFGAPLAEYGAVLRRAEATPEEATLVVELPARTDVRSFADRVRELAPSLELEAKRQHQRERRTAAELRNRIEADLTDRQHEALRTAFAEGYFEWPRESDGSEVADRLDITQPTFNKHLRLAERKTFAALFEGRV